MKSDDLVVKHNSIIEGFIDMTQNEYKLTLFLMSKIKKDETEFRKKNITVKEFADLLEVSEDKLYYYMKEFEGKLSSRKITVMYENGDRLSIPWFGYVKYIANQGTLEIAFNYDLSPFLLQINVNYTKYLISNIRKLDSIYAIRIYELLKQYEKVGERTISVIDLKNILCISSNEYKLYGDFKRRVILTPQKEINAKTDLFFDFEEIKNGKKVVKIKFKVKSKSDQCEIDSEIPDVSELMENFKKLTNVNLHSERLKELVELKGYEKVKFYIDNFDKISQGDIEDVAAYFYKAVLEEYEVRKQQIRKKGKPINSGNFEQRNYDDSFYDNLYENVKIQ